MRQFQNMDTYKLNASKMIAAQQRRNGTRSPESDSNWDSSEPEDTMPHVSSGDEDVSVMSSRSRGQASTTHTPRAPRPDGRAHLQPPKPVSNRLSANNTKASPVSSIKSASGMVSKPGVNVFVDRGSVDSSDEDVSVASQKSVHRKEEVPPYDFSRALQETPKKEDIRPVDRPGKSRKGRVYDPSPSKPEQSRKTDQKQPSPPDPAPPYPRKTSREKKWKVNLGFQSESAGDSKPAMPPKDNHGDNNDTAEQSQNFALATMTSTASDVELSRAEESIVGRAGPLGLGYTGEGSAYDQTGPDGTLGYMLEESTHRYIYHYQQGNVRYYDTRPSRNDVYMTGVADKSERLVRRGVQEVFGALRILSDSLLILLLELLRFLAFSVLGRLLVGLLATLGDFLLKPLLAALFNHLVQPPAVFLHNVGLALRTIAAPLADVLRGLLSPLVPLLRAFRLVEIHRPDRDGDIHNV